MSKRLQLRGGTTSQHNSFTGAVREVTVDTDKDTLVVHDGSTQGGFPLPRTAAQVSALIANDAIDSQHYAAGSIDAEHIAADAVTVAKLNLISTSSVPSIEARSDGTTDGYIQLNCTANSHGIKLKSPPHSAGASYTLTFPNNDGDANQMLSTNGSGVMSWASVGSNSITDGDVTTAKLAADAVTTAKIADDVGLGGNPTTTTQSASNNSTRIATTAYTDAAIAALSDSAPGTLNTLNELAAALGDDANYAASTATAIALRAPIASPTFTGNIGMPAGSIDHAFLAADCVDGDNIGDDVINSEHIAADSIDAEHLAPNSVNTDAIIDDSVTSAHLAAGAVDATALGNDVVNSQHIAADSIDAEHYAAGSVDATALGADAVTAAKIGDDVINSEHIAAGAVDAEHMSANSIDSASYVDGSIDTAHFATGAIDAAAMGGNSVASAALQNNAVQTAHITDGNVTAAKIYNDAVTADKIGDNVINSEHYAAGSIDAEHLASDSVTEAKMAANSVDSQAYVDGSIDTAHIGDAQVTGDKLNTDRRSTANGDVYDGNSNDYIHYDASDGIRFYSAGAEDMRLTDAGALHVDGDVIAFSTTISDATLKYDINPIEHALEKIGQLKGVTYKYLKDGMESAGLLAQDVEKVMPCAVQEHALPLHTGTEKKYKTLNYDNLHALLIESIKELTAKVEKLEKK